MNKTESQESGEHHLVFASDIKALPSLHFDASVGKKKLKKGWGVLLEAFQTLAFYQPALSTLMCLKQTVFFFFLICIFRTWIFHITTQQTPKGSKKKQKQKHNRTFFVGFFFWINASSDVL